MPFEEWVSRFSPSRARQLREAREKVGRHGLEAADAIMTVFIKTETSHNATDPRNISPRSAAFLATFGPFISAIEHLALDCPYLTKGLSPERRGAKTSEGWRHDITETDFSRFDMTVSIQMIDEFEHDFIRRAVPPGLYPDFDKALRLTRNLHGVSDLGNSYRILGTRASGDAHTSIANGVLNRFIIWACLRHLPPEKWTSFHEGDDGVINTDADVTADARSSLAFAGLLGFKLKVVVPPCHAMANFCGRFTCPECHVEQCDIKRTLTKFHSTTRQGDAKSLALAKALSYWSTDSHTPVIGTLCWSIITNLSPKVAHRLLRRRAAEVNAYERRKLLDGMNRNHCYVSPRACCRSTAALQTDWDVALQLSFETQLRDWSICVTEVPPLQVDDYLVDGTAHVIY